MQEGLVPSSQKVVPLCQLRELIAAGTLQEVLEPLSKSGDLLVTCTIEGRRYEISAGSAKSLSADSSFDMGCLARNLTSLLVAIAVSRGLLRMEDHVSRFYSEMEGRSSDLRIFHLLNHTHGLDGSLLGSMPTTARGRIDAATIWRKVQEVPVLAPPGALFYYYGKTGFWLAAAILEAIYEAPFGSLLLKELKFMDPAQIISSVCPAYGVMPISRSQLMEVGEFHLRNHVDERLSNALRALRSNHRVTLPPWPPIADAASPGWFSFGSSVGMWGGGDSVSSFMLISPAENSTVVLTARSKRAFHLARRALLGSIFAKREMGTPRPLNKNERASMQMARVLGTYHKASNVLDICSSLDGGLHAQIFRRGPTGKIESTPIITRTLIPAIDDTFYPTVPEPVLLPFIKLWNELPNGTLKYASTGKHIFRRIGD